MNPKSAFKIAFICVMVKFMLAGMTIFGHQVPQMTGSDLAMALVAVGGIHSLSTHVDNLARRKNEDKDKDS